MALATVPELSRAMQEQETRLLAEFRGRVGAEIVSQTFRDALDGLAGARVKIYVGVLAYRLTRDRLTELSASGG